MKQSATEYSKKLFGPIVLMFLVLFSAVPIAGQGDFYVIPVVSMTFRGDWDVNTSYNQKDVVFYNGSSWFSLVGPNKSNVPSDASTQWTMLAQKGDQGPVNPNAETLDGKHSSDFALSSHTQPFSTITGTATDAQMPATITRDTELTSGLATKANTVHQHSGGDVTTGTVAEARIDPLITRDSELNTGLATKAPLAHIHDDRYFTEAETNTLLSGKASLSHTHLFSAITGQITNSQIPDNQVSVGKISTSGSSAGQVLTATAAGASWQPQSGLALPYVGLLSTNQAAFWVSNLGENGTGVFGVGTNGIGVVGHGDGNPGYGVWGKHIGTGNEGVIGRSWVGVFGKGLGNSRGVHGQSENATGVHGQTGDGYGVYGESTNGVGVEGINTVTGNYGELGTSLAGVHGRGGIGVYADSTTGGTAVYGTTSGDGIYGESTGAGSGVFANSSQGDGITSYSNGTYKSGVYALAYGTSGYGGYFVATNGTGLLAMGTSAAATFQGDVNVNGGRVRTPVLEITGGSDLSEKFKVKNIGQPNLPDPGMVVSIDPQKPGDLVVSISAYDRKVAGIISGAGGVKPGMTMGQKESIADGEIPVALSGRVYCWVDASYDDVEPGDLLTTSETPGHAMKVADFNKAQGAILGKAMTKLKKGKGLVLVLVTLQ